VLAHVEAAGDEFLSLSSLPELLLPVVLGILYFRRVRRLHTRDAAPSRLRQLSFTAGLLVVLGATVGPMDGLADDFVYGHMIQHILLTEEAALLLAIGLTGPIMRPILILPVLRHLRVLVYPPLALALWITLIYAWHVPVLYQAAEEHPLLHLLEHACFLGAGIAMWLALLGPLPKPAWFGYGAKAGYTAAVHFSMMGMANLFMWSGVVFYPIYAESEQAGGISALTDQGIAGAVLAAQSAVIMISVLAWILLSWAKEDTERQELIDLADRLQVPLSEERAKRAAAAGRGAELRERIEREASRRRPGPPEPAPG
jgi:cytochrome c oxidase assembly factor CtaG